LASKIKEKLPKMFRIAEIESSRARKIGMKVGSLREKIIIALLITHYGKERVNADIFITKSEIDVLLDGKPISIKTITRYGDIKAVWTVDAKSSKNFIYNYAPKCDIILVRIFWNSNKGGVYFIPLEVQNDIFSNLGRDNYFKMPKPETNSRGIKYSRESIKMFLSHPLSKRIEVDWIKEELDYNVYDAYKRWEDYWNK